MKLFKIIAGLALLCLFAGGAVVALAQTNNNYTCVSTSVTSATVPTAIFTPNRITTWIAHARSSPAADPVLIFPYVGPTVPTAVPSPAGVMEIPSGSSVSDAVTCPASTCLDAIGEGWAAVLAGGSTGQTVDFCSR